MNIKSDHLFYALVVFFSVFYIFITKNFEYYNDDFTMLEFRDQNYLKSFFIADAWWRPFKNIFYNFFNLNFYMMAHPIIITKIIIHAFLTIIIFNFLKKIENNLSTILLSLIFFVSQTNFSAAIAIDTLGQLLAVFFGLISFFYIYGFIKSGKKINLLYSHLFIVLGFLTKEVAVTFVILNIFTLIYYSKFNFIFKFDQISRKQVVKISIIFISIVLIYLILRKFLGATWQPTAIGSDRYSLGFGINLINNFILFFFSTINPLDNLYVYLSIKNKNIFLILLIFIFFMLYFALLTKYFIKNFNPELFFKFSILLISCLPVIFLNKVAELYTYTSTFFFVFFLQELFKNKGRSFLILLVFLNFSSSVNKFQSFEIISNKKKKIDIFLNKINNEIKNKDIYVIHNKSKFKYSYYHLPSFDWIYPSFQLKKDFGKDYVLVFDESNYNFKDAIIIRSEESSEKDYSLRPKACFNFYYSSKKTICNF